MMKFLTKQLPLLYWGLIFHKMAISNEDEIKKIFEENNQNKSIISFIWPINVLKGVSLIK